MREQLGKRAVLLLFIAITAVREMSGVCALRNIVGILCLFFDFCGYGSVSSARSHGSIALSSWTAWGEKDERTLHTLSYVRKITLRNQLHETRAKR